MLVDAISLLLHRLNRYCHQQDGNPAGTADPVIWGNIAQLDHPDIGTDLENQVVLTLVNVEEESALKNRSAVAVEPTGVVYQNPPLHLNLFLLFSANYRNYQTALLRLAQVLAFFQGQRKLTHESSPGASPGLSPFAELSLTMDLLSLSLEEINHLWGSLGGKQIPFAIYRGRLVVLRDRRVLDAGGEVRETVLLAGGHSG